MKLLSRIRLLATPWTAAYQAPQSMGFSRQEYWSGLQFPSPGDPAAQLGLILFNSQATRPSPSGPGQTGTRSSGPGERCWLGSISFTDDERGRKSPQRLWPKCPHSRKGGEAPLSRGLSEGFPWAYCRVVSRTCEGEQGRAPGLAAFLTHPRSLLSRTAASGSAACTCCSGASSCCTNMSPVGWSR